MKQVPARVLSSQHMDWIGATPPHWQVVPLKSLFKIVGGSTPKSDQPQFWDGEIIWITPVDLAKDEIADLHSSQRTITEEGLESCGTSLVPPNSIVLSTRAPIGSLGVAKVALCTNQGCKTLVPSSDVDPRFVAFTLSIAKEQLRIRGKGTTFLELSGDELGAFRIAAPNLREQTAIAAFLDRETAKIDALVEEQKRLIDLLKEKRQAVISHAVTKGLNPNAQMKDSGIEWLGEVPKHWCLGRLKHVAEVRGRIGFRGYTAEDLVAEGDGALTLGGANLSDSGRVVLESRTYLSWQKYEESPEIKIEKGDVLIGQRGTCGRAVVVNQDLGPATINPSLVVLKELKVSPQFMTYWLMGDLIQKTFDSFLNKTAVPMLSQQQIGNVPVVFPTLAEQMEICAHVSGKLDEFDELLRSSDAGIALLQERRAALISAAVTGKINVQAYVDTRHNQSDVRAAVGFEIVRRLAHRPTFGRVKLQKIVYLAETYAEIEELSGSYQREAAGPLDRKLISDIETLIQKDGEVIIEQPEGRGSAVRYRFIGQRPKTEKEDVGRLLGDRRQRFELVLNKVGDLDTKGAEAVATLFAVWNDALIDQTPMTDEGILTSFLREWHPEKPLKFKRDELHTWLGWMRRNGIIPMGRGPRTQTGRLVI